MSSGTGRVDWLEASEWVLKKKVEKFSKYAGISSKSSEKQMMKFLWVWKLEGNRTLLIVLERGGVGLPLHNPKKVFISK